MMNCVNPDHWPQAVSVGERDSHLHCGGRVELVDGKPCVVDRTPCDDVRPCDFVSASGGADVNGVDELITNILAEEEP